MAQARHIIHEPQAGSDWAYDLVQAQQRIEDFRNEIYRLTPWMDGVLLEDVELSAYVANDIPHKLGRKLKGWYTLKRPSLNCSLIATLSSDQTGILASTFTLINLDGVSYDTGGDFDTSTGLFTAPHTGLYRFDASIRYNSTLVDGSRVILSIRRNGSIYRRFNEIYMGASSDPTAVGSIQDRLSAGDTVGLYAWQNSGTETVQATTSEGTTDLVVNAVDDLGDGQGDSGLDDTKFLRLYSSCDRTVDLWVY